MFGVNPKTMKKKEKDLNHLIYDNPESLLISVEFIEKLNSSLELSFKEKPLLNTLNYL